MTGGYAEIRRREADGLTVQFIDKKGFYGVYAALSVHAGGNDRLVRDGSSVRPIAPGAAHFLEHLVFSSRDQAFSKALAARGISGNAMTKHEETVFYAFSVGEAVYTVETLLNAVSMPDFGEPEVAKEKAVILAELDMVENDPSYRLHETLMRSLYRRHPVRDDIGGDRASVSGLGTHDLKAFYETYYKGSNVQLTVAGDLDHTQRDAIEALAKQAFPISKTAVLRPFVEDRSASEGGVIQYFDRVDVPQFAVGLKIDPAVWPADPVERYVARSRFVFWLETYFGTLSPDYDRLMMNGLIDDGFHFGLWQGSDFSMLLFSGHSRRPDEAANTVLDTLLRAVHERTDVRLFDLVRQSAVGKLLKRHDSVHRLGALAANMLRKGVDVYTLPDLYAKISIPPAGAFADLMPAETARQIVLLCPGT